MKGTQDVIRSCIVAKVIIVTFARGDGKDDICRLVHQYYDLRGNLLAENDTWIKDKDQPIGHSSEYTKWRPDER